MPLRKCSLLLCMSGLKEGRSSTKSPTEYSSANYYVFPQEEDNIAVCVSRRKHNNHLRSGLEVFIGETSS